MDELQTAWKKFVALKEHQAQVEEQKARLMENPEYRDVMLEEAAVANDIDKTEAEIKVLMKDTHTMALDSDHWEAVMTERRTKGTIHYDIQAIEQEPTLATCITKTVNERLFKAVVQAKELDASMFCTPEEDKITLAVSIREKDDPHAAAH